MGRSLHEQNPRQFADGGRWSARLADLLRSSATLLARCYFVCVESSSALVEDTVNATHRQIVAAVLCFPRLLQTLEVNVDVRRAVVPNLATRVLEPSLQYATGLRTHRLTGDALPRLQVQALLRLQRARSRVVPSPTDTWDAAPFFLIVDS